MAATDLTTLQSLKAWLGITNAADDANLTRLITAASQFFTAKCGRSLQEASYSETRNGYHVPTFDGGRQMVLNNWPIQSVQSLTIDGLAIPQQGSPPGELGPAGYTFDNDTIYLVGYAFNRGFQNVTIAYTAGYAQGSIELLNIEQAVIELCAQKYRRKSHVDENSQMLQGMTVAFSQRDIPPEVQTVIEMYRRRW